MMLISFRSRLTPEAGEDYQAMDAELEGRVREQPGYVAHRSYLAAGRGATHPGLVPGPGLAPELEDASAARGGAAPGP